MLEKLIILFAKSKRFLTTICLVFAMESDRFDQLHYRVTCIHELTLLITVGAAWIMLDPAFNAWRAKDLIVTVMTFNGLFRLRDDAVADSTHDLIFDLGRKFCRIGFPLYHLSLLNIDLK